MWISSVVDPGKGPGGARSPPLIFFFQNEARRAEKIYFGDRRPPLSQGLDDQPPPPYLMVWIRHYSLQCLRADSRVLCI